MIRNYFKIAWRTLMKNKVFSFINIFGLSIGLACCMLITLYLNNEMSYDQDQPLADQIYQVGTVFVQGGKDMNSMPNTPHPMANGLQREFPEVADATHLLGMFADDKTLLQFNPGNGQTTHSFYETKGYLTDPSFF
ncbi:MAG TPA: ABC transporter permease, partial [Sediminibacterium sp.]